MYIICHGMKCIIKHINMGQKSLFNIIIYRWYISLNFLRKLPTFSLQTQLHIFRKSLLPHFTTLTDTMKFMKLESSQHVYKQEDMMYSESHPNLQNSYYISFRHWHRCRYVNNKILVGIPDVKHSSICMKENGQKFKYT